MLEAAAEVELTRVAVRRNLVNTPIPNHSERRQGGDRRECTRVTKQIAACNGNGRLIARVGRSSASKIACRSSFMYTLALDTTGTDAINIVYTTDTVHAS